MGTILWLRKGIYETRESYYRSVEVEISTAELEKWKTKNHMELNKAYVDWDDEDDRNRFQ